MVSQDGEFLIHVADELKADKEVVLATVSNTTFKNDDDRYYVPLEKVDNDAVKLAGLKFASGDIEHFTSKPYVPSVGNGS